MLRQTKEKIVRNRVIKRFNNVHSTKQCTFPFLPRAADPKLVVRSGVLDVDRPMESEPKRVVTTRSSTLIGNLEILASRLSSDGKSRAQNNRNA